MVVIGKPQKMKDEELKNRLAMAASYMSRVGLSKRDYIFVGSTVLGALGLRSPGDIDIALHSAAYTRILRDKTIKKEIIKSSGTINLSSDCQVLRDRYNDIRHNDDKIFADPELSFDVLGYRFARPELEMAKKISRNYDKDLIDVDLLIDFAVANNSYKWNWDYLAYARPQSRKELLIKGLRQCVRRPLHVYRRAKLLLVARFSRGLSDRRGLRELPTQSLDIGVLIQKQMKMGFFERYDVLMRKRVVDKLSNQNNILGFLDADLPVLKDYDKMQKARVSRNTRLSFLRLIDGISRVGLDPARFPIELNKSGKIFDGSHRTACALSFNVEFMPVRINKLLSVKPQYGRNWFESKFEDHVLDELDAMEKDVLLRTGAAFTLILWPPALAMLDDVVEFLQTRVRVLKIDSNVELIDLNKFVKELYRRDGISDWKVARKIEFFQNYKASLAMISFSVVTEDYKYNGSTGTYLSASVAALKGSIRSMLCCRVPNYFSDVVCHSGDNPQMNREIRELVEAHRVQV